MLDIDAILSTALSATGASRREIGRSRQGRPIHGYRFGRGSQHVSLIAGCHADEPVGPAMLDRLAAHLAATAGSADARQLDAYSLWIVPHVNPDGDALNAAWAGGVLDPTGSAREIPDVDLAAYSRHAVRELPGDDVEFGFPRQPNDDGYRPENGAVADFLRPGAPFALHASFHGMAFAAGPWFLLERAWIDRTAVLRDRLRARVAELGYRLHDIDRGGDKGFHRIDEGFTTRPDSRAMIAHFESLGDTATAALFRPSSMEFVRSLGGDPLTLVSEMPLFLTPASFYKGENLVRPPQLGELQALVGNADALRSRAFKLGVRPMPIADQMRLQLEYLAAALEAVRRSTAS